jgi:uncharacterized protein
MLPLPNFRYHPHPLLTKSIVASSAKCLACRRSRGFIYDGPVIAAEDYDKAFCPWCIADGSVGERFEAEFTDVIYGRPNDVPADVVHEIASRTPGFFGWQQEHWLYHCGDGAAFLGCVGAPELEVYPDAVQAVRSEMVDSRWREDQIDKFINSLRNDQSPSAYLFRCLRCERYLAYSDFS